MSEDYDSVEEWEGSFADFQKEEAWKNVFSGGALRVEARQESLFEVEQVRDRRGCHNAGTKKDEEHKISFKTFSNPQREKNIPRQNGNLRLGKMRR